MFGVLNIILQLVVTMVALPMGVAVLVMAMRHANGKTVAVGEVFKHFGTMGRLLGCYLLQLILIVIGMILLVLPGIYLMFAYMFAMPLIVEKKMGVWQALETSRKAVTKVWFRFFGLTWLITLINVLAVFTLGIAWIWTIPWSILTMSLIHIKLFVAEAQTLAD